MRKTSNVDLITIPVATPCNLPKHGKLRPHFELLTHAVEMKDIGRVGLLHREDTIKGISAIVKASVRVKAGERVGKKHGTFKERYGFGKG